MDLKTRVLHIGDIFIQKVRAYKERSVSKLTNREYEEFDFEPRAQSYLRKERFQASKYFSTDTDRSHRRSRNKRDEIRVEIAVIETRACAVERCNWSKDCGRSRSSRDLWPPGGTARVAISSGTTRRKTHAFFPRPIPRTRGVPFRLNFHASVPY